MRILYIHQYFKTPQEPGGTRSYWIAKELINSGHEVVMLTTSSKINCKKSVQLIDGIKVIYLKVLYEQEMSILARLKSFASFMIKASIESFKADNIDMVIATSTPLTIGLPALLLKKIKGIPYVFEVRDLWPEVPIQMGGLKNPIVIKLANWFEETIYRNAEHIVALSPGMAKGVISKHVPEKKVTMIPNMSKGDEFWPREKNYELALKLGLKSKSFKVIHFGSLGIANGASTIIESAKLLLGNEKIEFVFLGGGSTEASLIHLCKIHALTNVHFLGAFPMDETSEIVNMCDVSVVSFLDLPILYTNSPNKLFDSLSAGKPILVNSAGWTKDLVETHQCGYYVNPNKPIEMAEKIAFLEENPEVVKKLGLQSRKIAEERYDKSILCQQFAQMVKDLHIDKYV